MAMNSNFDALTEAQKEVADLMVQNAIERKKGSAKKIRQHELAEAVGVTDRTIRNWQHDELFLEYVGYLSRLKLQAAMPDFVAVLIANLDKGQNVSTKQLDLIAKVADWLPEKQGANHTLNVNVGNTLDIDDRIKQLQERKQSEVIDNRDRQIETTEEAIYRETD